MVNRKGVANVAATDVQETDTSFQLCRDGQILTFSSARYRFLACTTVMCAGNRQGSNTTVVRKAGHPAVHSHGSCLGGNGYFIVCLQFRRRSIFFGTGSEKYSRQ